MGKAKLAEKDIKKGRSSSPQVEKKIKKEKKSVEKGEKPKKEKRKSVKFNLDDNQEFEIEPRSKKQQNNEEKEQKNGASKTSAMNSALAERGWNQSMDSKQTGKFTDEEIHILKESLCKYAFEKGLGEAGLQKLVSEKATKETLGAWTQIAECLPYRTVQSCHNFCRRRFNPNNYGGKWTEKETNELVGLVKEHGRKWKLIGQTLGRTETNVRDKYKSIGEDNATQRKIEFWSLDELVQLVKLISTHTGLKIIKHRKSMKEEIKKNGARINEESEEFNQNRQRIRDISQIDPNTKFLLNFISYQQVKDLGNYTIPWTKIAEEIGTRSKDDCKNKWTQQLMKIIFEYSGNFDGEDEEDLVQQISNQDVDSESEIDFTKIENGKTTTENKMKWNILKKRISSRQNVTVPNILKELLDQFKKSKIKSVSEDIIKNSSSELLNYFKSQYMN